MVTHGYEISHSGSYSWLVVVSCGLWLVWLVMVSGGYLWLMVALLFIGNYLKSLGLYGGGGGGLVTKSCPTLETPWTVVRQSPLSMGFLK